jgi:hypothetical protein
MKQTSWVEWIIMLGMLLCVCVWCCALGWVATAAYHFVNKYW